MGYMNEAYSKYDELTKEYMKEKCISEIKSYSLYFTPPQMADILFKDLIIIKKDSINILDTSCGNGILILKLLENIIVNHLPKEINIYAFDVDQILINNVKSVLSKIDFISMGITLNTHYYCKDYLKSKLDVKCDYIVMNPPYKKINIAEVPTDLKGIIIGQPNLYHLFILKSLEDLHKEGVLCILAPKNYLSGKYTQKLREKIINNYSIYKIHTFNDRRNVFDVKVTQEVCIVHITGRHYSEVILSYNGNDSMQLPFKKLLLDSKTNIIKTPRNRNDYELINKFSKFPKGVIGSNILMKTGKVVQFRVKNKFLCDEEYQHIKEGMPLIVYRHINTGALVYAKLTNKTKNKSVSICDNSETQSLLIDNRNYIILRKNTDKKYEKLISCIAYMKSLQTNKLGIDNGLAYLTNEEDSLTELEVRGIECILMSKQFDDYYRMINSSHTLNVYEFENLHFPDMNTIRAIGKDLAGNTVTGDLATKIMEKYL